MSPRARSQRVPAGGQSSASVRLPRVQGLTLVEVIASLTLLGALATACATILQIATRASDQAAHAAAWRRAAESLLDSIAADVTSGDLDPIGDRARGEPRITLEPSRRDPALDIRTRTPDAGSCRRRYAIAGDSIVVTTRPLTGPAAPYQSSNGVVALGHVHQFEARWVADPHRLLVSLRGAGSAAVTRVIVVDDEVLP